MLLPFVSLGLVLWGLLERGAGEESGQTWCGWEGAVARGGRSDWPAFAESAEVSD